MIKVDLEKARSIAHDRRRQGINHILGVAKNSEKGITNDLMLAIPAMTEEANANRDAVMVANEEAKAKINAAESVEELKSALSAVTPIPV